MLFLDLDGFKAVNDGWGHAQGDALLRDVAGRLAGALRTGDTVARIGGDEFTVLIPELPQEEGAVEVSRKILRELERAFRVGEQRVRGDGEHRDRAVPPRRGDRGRAAAQRGRRHVPGQGAGRQPVRLARALSRGRRRPDIRAAPEVGSPP